MGVLDPDIEKIQRLTARTVATNPAGHNLLLIGGFCYRLLDQSARVSMDIDYHWSGDMDLKQEELLRLCRRSLVPQVRREMGYEGEARRLTGPEAESPNARFIELRFWKAGRSITLPLEVTRIVCMDPSTIKTAEGVVYPTPTDLDLIESKLLAVMNRLFVQHRDFVDIFLFGDRLSSESPQRLAIKLKIMDSNPEALRRRLEDFQQNLDYHTRAVQKILDTQLDFESAAQINAGGGGKTVFQRALETIRNNIQA